jgi:hypothetical protein
MTDNELAKQLHEPKRRRERPLPLIEMFDELLSLAPGLSEKQKHKRSDEIIATALKTVGTQGCLITAGGWRGRSTLISPLAETTVPSGLSGSSAPGVAAAPSTWCNRDRAAIARSNRPT